MANEPPERESDTLTPPPAASAPVRSSGPRRIAIYVVAKDAVRSLAGVLDRIPAAVSDRVEEIFVFDSGSEDTAS